MNSYISISDNSVYQHQTQPTYFSYQLDQQYPQPTHIDYNNIQVDQYDPNLTAPQRNIFPAKTPANDKFQWIKLSHQGKVKRVHMPERSFLNLLDSVRRHFKVIDLELISKLNVLPLKQVDSNLIQENQGQVQASLYNEEQMLNLFKVLNMYYIDDEGDDIEIDSDETLEQAVRYFRHIRNQQAILKVNVQVVGIDDQSPQKEVVDNKNGQVLEQIQNQDFNQSEILNLESGIKLRSHLLNDTEEEKKFEDYSNLPVYQNQLDQNQNSIQNSYQQPEFINQQNHQNRKSSEQIEERKSLTKDDGPIDLNVYRITQIDKIDQVNSGNQALESDHQEYQPAYNNGQIEYRFTEGISKMNSDVFQSNQFQSAALSLGIGASTNTLALPQQISLDKQTSNSTAYIQPQQQFQQQQQLYERSAFDDSYSSSNNNSQLFTQPIQDKEVIGLQDLMSGGNSRTNQDMQAILSALNTRSSLMQDDLSNQQMIQDQIEAYKKLQLQQKDDEAYARELMFQEQIRNNQPTQLYGSQIPNQPFQQANLPPTYQQQNIYDPQSQFQGQGMQPAVMNIKPMKMKIICSCRIIQDEKSKRRHDATVKKKSKIMSVFSDDDNKWTDEYKSKMVQFVPITGQSKLPISPVTLVPGKQGSEIQKVVVKWDIVNRSQSHWDESNLILRSQKNNIPNSNLHLTIDPMYVKKGVKPSRIETLEVTLNIPIRLLQQTNLELGFQFESSKRKMIGEKLFVNLDCRQSLVQGQGMYGGQSLQSTVYSIPYKQNDQQASQQKKVVKNSKDSKPTNRPSQQQQNVQPPLPQPMNQMQNNMPTDPNMNRPHPEMSQEQQLNYASQLSDETGHEFELCLTFMQDFQNNYGEAKKALLALKL
eukprot:403368545